MYPNASADLPGTDPNHALTLSPLARSDVQGLLPFFSDMYAMRTYLPQMWRTYNKEQLEGLLDDWHDNITNFCYAVRRSNDHALIGFANVSNIDWASHTAEIGLAITDASLRGKGFGRQSGQLLVDYCFRQMGLRRLYAHIIAINRPSIALFESLGFVHEGTMREHVLRDGQFLDMLVYGLLIDSAPMIE